ncbi:beta-ketoacyl synthase N-terminal-like domain-containing protein [Streptomyces sp. NPDC001599]|uniref:beta-ketoacyl synthase N-terminal-like domain-containing protein n=1 Tax=Streptomyces sp. NPDC001599 TaxID=3364591 RepID=UPI00368DDFBB
MDPVLVTGVGAVTCHGTGVPALGAAMDRARGRQPDKVPDPWARMELPLMYLVPEPALDEEPDTGPGRATTFALRAAHEALAGAGLDRDALRAARAAVVLGTCMGALGDRERERDRDRERARERSGGAAPSAPPHDPPAAPDRRPDFEVSSRLAADLGVTGAASSTSNACAASGFALATAADMIRCGEADVVVTGGADAYSRIALANFNRLGAVDAHGCRPFAADRAGTVFGEGAGVVVLESAAYARARGARPLAEVGEAGWSCDAGHPTAPEESGEQIVRALRDALDRTHVEPHEIGCVIPHGTGTRLNDRIESAALRTTFGPRTEVPPLYSLKALLGHTGGAAAALAAVAATVVLGRGTVPPNVPVGAPDPDCSVPLPTAATPLTARSVLVNAYAFGGNNISLVLREALPC